MKKLFAAVCAVLVLMLGVFTSCDDGSSDPQFYYYEMGRVTMANYNAIKAAAPGPYYSFNEIVQIRNALRAKTIDNFASGTDLTEADMYPFLTTHGVTPSEANAAIAALKTRGNIIMGFTYAYDPTNYAIWVYVQR